MEGTFHENNSTMVYIYFLKDSTMVYFHKSLETFESKLYLAKWEPDPNETRTYPIQTYLAL